VSAPPALPALYVICDEAVCAGAGWALPAFAAACVEGGARLVQLRVKTASSRRFFEMTCDIVSRTGRTGAQVIVNDRADIARMAGAAGAHVGQADLSPVDVRRVVGEKAIVGVSTHTAEQVRAALREPVSYIAIGPVFGTTTKDTGYSEVGLDLVREVAGIASSRGIPLVAIGGITLDRARAVLNAGADAVAVISDLLVTGDPAGRVRQFLETLQQEQT